MSESAPPARPRWRMILGREVGLAIAFILLAFPWYGTLRPAAENLGRSGAEAVDLVAKEQRALGGSRSVSIDWIASALSRLRLLALASVSGASLALLLAPRRKTPRLACAAAALGAAGVASIIFGELRSRQVPRVRTWFGSVAPPPDATSVIVEAAPFLVVLLPLVGLLLRKRWTRGTLLALVPVLGWLSLTTLPEANWSNDECLQWGPRAVNALLAVALVIEGTAPLLLATPETDPDVAA